MSIVSFLVLVMLLVIIGLFFTEAFRERICIPLVRRIVARRQMTAMRALEDQS